MQCKLKLPKNHLQGKQVIYIYIVSLVSFLSDTPDFQTIRPLVENMWCIFINGYIYYIDIHCTIYNGDTL